MFQLGFRLIYSSSRLRIKEILFALEIVDRDRDSNLSHIIATYELDSSVMCALVINHNSFNLAIGAFLINPPTNAAKMRMHVARRANDRALDSNDSLQSGVRCGCCGEPDNRSSTSRQQLVYNEPFRRWMMHHEIGSNRSVLYC